MGTIAQVSGPMAQFPKGFSGGLNLQGLQVVLAMATSAGPENTINSGVYWVDSVNGVDGPGGGGLGGTQMNPFKTTGRAFAVAKAKDVIILKPYHTDTVSSSTSANGKWNVKGVQVIGLGVGASRPTITLDTANTSTITVSANDISVSGVIFVANFLNIAALFTLTTAKGFTVSNCTARDTSASLNFIDYFQLSTTSNANDQLSVLGNNINGLATSGAVKLLDVLGTHDSVTVAGNTYLTLTTGTGAIMPIATTKKLTNFLFLNNLINVQNATGTATGYLITSDTAGTGFIHGNYLSALPTTPLLVTAGRGYVYGANYHTDQPDLQGYLVPAADV